MRKSCIFATYDLRIILKRLIYMGVDTHDLRMIFNTHDLRMIFS